MHDNDPDMVTIERAARVLGISVEEAQTLADRYQSIRRVQWYGTTRYSLLGFQKMHLIEATQRHS